MDVLALIVAIAALATALRNKPRDVGMPPVDNNLTRDIAQQVVDRHEQNHHRR